MAVRDYGDFHAETAENKNHRPRLKRVLLTFHRFLQRNNGSRMFHVPVEVLLR